MAGKTAILSVRILGDAKGAKSAMSETEKASRQMEDGLNKASVGAGLLVGGLALLAKRSTDAASALQQSTGAVESVFGAHAAGMQRLAEQAAQNVGLAQSEYQDLAAVLGSQLKNMGMPMEDVATRTENLIGLGADLAATFGGTTADAVAAVSSLLRGERDPIERYGVSIKQADINARLAAEGLTGLEGEAAKAAETQAVLGLLTDQTAAAAGQFAREADTAAGAQQRANAEWQNAQAELGEKLLPIVTQVTEALAGMATWVGDNSELALTLAGTLGALAAGILLVKGGIEAYRAVAAIATAVQIAWNIALNANPIGLIITAVGLLAVLILNLTGGWDEMGKAAQDAAAWVGEIFGASGGPAPGPAVAPGVVQPLSAPATFAAMSFSPSAAASPAESWGRPTMERSESAAGPTYKIDVHGAIDPDGTARTIDKVLKTHGKRVGTTGGSVTQWRS